MLSIWICLKLCLFVKVQIHASCAHKFRHSGKEKEVHIHCKIWPKICNMGQTIFCSASNLNGQILHCNIHPAFTKTSY